ncbi:MAG: glycoside hydrolase family 2 TIM barrel-domain containing protein, partial [Verrucomicrobiota bacterium]
EALPPDFERQTIRRGTEWFVKSRLLVHPSWQERYDRPSNMGPPTQDWPWGHRAGPRPDPSWAIGDGSLGMLEGFRSRILRDGSQAVIWWRRHDNSGEIAGAMTMAGALLQDERFQQIGGHLGDWLYTQSLMTQGDRADPNNGAFGLAGWNDVPRYYGNTHGYDVYYADDNARGMLGMIKAAAALKTERWDERLAHCLLANLRITSRLGFSPERMDGPLPPDQWRSRCDSQFTFFDPHHQAYLQACYLWAYRQTGDRLFLDRAKSAIRLTMEAYPDRWKWTNGQITLERARFILALAWLVRVEDTPEHRAWLDRMVKDLLTDQVACGAIRTRIVHSPTSNEAYGTGETSLVEHNGDPVSDLLYESNFALVGLHEAAAATSNADYRKAEDKLAEYICRIQARSETHPDLDGVWYRGFDFHRWQYWAADADVGWSLWSTETGWTQAEILSTLVLRQLDTSLWEYTAASKISRPLDLWRKKMLPAEALSDRAQINLSGIWSFQVDRQNAGETNSWFADEYDVKSWREVDVPVAFDNCGPDMDRYIGVGWFCKHVHVPESFRGRRIVLHFEGINYNAKVWLNGKRVGENHDAFLPFTLPINDAVKIGAENQITLRVDNLRTRGQFPLFEGWHGQGGFLREACVMATDQTHLLRTFVEAEPAPGGGQLRLRAAVTNGVNRALPLQIQVRVLDAKGKELTTLRSAAASLAPGQVGELTVEGAVPGVQSWSPKTPVLYTAHVTLMSCETPLDVLTRRVGFRRVEVKDAKILLNGEPLFLMGFNRHEDSPRTGMAVDLAQAREDYTAMKQMGCNYVRLCHYPHHPGELDLCDELGLLVLAENGMNGWGQTDRPHPNGGADLTPAETPLVVEHAKRTLRKMVLRDNHHPSIILWSVGNENSEGRTDISKANDELIQYGQTLDRSRPWTHVSFSHGATNAESFYRFDDVIVVNVYASLYVSGWVIGSANLEAKLPQATSYLQGVLAKLHAQFPQKPIVVGEFGYPGGENGARGGELQALATEAEFKGLSGPYVAGGALWLYARHTWATKAFYSEGNLISPYGYVSRDRKTSFPALSVVERL